jgi:5-methylcytosine-specific restriction endonuclease McrA
MYDDDKLNKIYDKTDGHCHICHKKLAFTNYGVHGARGAWHVEHSVSKAKGGSDHLNNLYPGCIKCNLEKGTMHTKTARAWNNKSRAPYSAAKKKKIRSNNTVSGAVIGGAAGSIFGPAGTIIGAAIGGAIGNSNSPKK